VGKRNLEAAARALGPKVALNVEWHAFELDPSAPRSVASPVPHAEWLAKKYGVTRAQGQNMIDRMVGMGKKVGIPFDFESIHRSNTFDAHRLLCFAKARSKKGDLELQGALKERLLAAHHTEGVALGDTNELLRLAADVGLDVDAASAVLQTDDFSRDVREDEAAAHSLGVRGVPFFVVGRYSVSGAQPPDLLKELLERAQRDDASKPEVPEADVCTPESC
jgi:predicted DsbA family dithiol-disulfide isomerase